MAHDGASLPQDGRMLSAVLDDFPDPVFVKDAAHRWVYHNAAFARLLGTEDLLGRDDSAFYPPEQVAVFWAGDDAVIAGGEVVVQEEAIGEGFWALVKKWPVTLPDGGKGLAGLIYDISDYRGRALEAEKLRAASHAKSEFLAAMSHELRTPLNGVLGVAALLERGARAAGMTQHVALVGVIQRSARHFLSLIEDMFDASRLEAGRMRLARDPFDPAQAVADAVALLRPLAEAKGLTLDMAVTGVEGLLLGDDGRLRQVMSNLIGNAIKFTTSGGVRARLSAAPVLIGEKSPGRLLRFEVEDSGPGIPADRQEAVFEPFTQVEQGATRRHGGAGLGLAICRDIVGLMGGRIGLRSVEGRGSTFWVEIPLETAPEAGPAAEPPRLPPPRRDGGLDVLLFEDNSVNREVAVAMLEADGFAVRAAEDGRDAAALRATLAPRLILMDLSMPEVDGLEAARAIRAAEAAQGLPRAPMLGLTAYADEDSRCRCLESGMDERLSKPLGAEELTAALARWMAPAD